MNLAPNCPIDLDTLMQTRMLIVAGSGGGKSYALRKLIEETAPKVQQLIIDPEGEYASLREQHDYILVAAKDGDVPASPKTAAVLARRLLELGVSAILDLYELPVHDRQWFVKNFLDALVNAPKESWKQVMVVLDEAHIYCPQNGSAEAMQSVIDVASRGRKRGLCLVLASQRISKLHKDTAAEMQNKLIGLTNLDVDRKRAAEELGMTVKEAVGNLRLDRGEFYAFGPALTKEVTKIKVGKVKTSHASGAGKLAATPPAPSAAVKKQLVKLADLTQVAAKEAATMQELKDEIAKLKRDARKPERDPQEAFESGFLGGQVEAEKEWNAKVKAYAKDVDGIVRDMNTRINSAITALDSLNGFTLPPMDFIGEPFKPLPKGSPPIDQARNIIAREALPKSGKVFGPPATIDSSGAYGALVIDAYPQLKSGAVRIIQELVARAPAGYTKSQVGALTKFTTRGGTFQTYMSVLRKNELVVERDGLLFATEKACHLYGGVKAVPTTHEEAMAMWRKSLKSGAYKMLEVVVNAKQDGIHRASLADLVNMEVKGGTFQTYVSTLRRNGLIEEQGKRLYANDILFP